MAGEFRGLTIKFRGDTGDLSKALSTINGEMRGTQRNLNEVQRLLMNKEGSRNVELLGRKMQLTTDRVSQWQERVDTLQAAQDELGERTDENAAAYDKVSERLAMAKANLEQYTAAMHEAEAAYDRQATMLGKVGQGMQDAGGTLSKLGDGMQSAGQRLTTSVTLPLVAGATAAVKATMDVDDALTGVRKTVDGTEEQYQQLRDAAIEASKQQPVDAATILNIQSLGAQLGFGIDELQEFSRVASGLDVATNMNWEDAATNMAQFSNIMQMSHDDVGRYASTIVALGNNFATTEADVSNMSMRIAAAGKQVGLSEAEVLGLSAALTSMGVEAEAGGTAISTIMSNIDKDVATGSENLGKWAEVAGKSSEEFSKAWKDNAAGALSDVLSGMQKSVDEGGNMSVMLDELGISSLRQTDVMKRLAGNAEFMGDAVAKANTAWEENIALDKEVENRNSSISSKLQVLANKVTAVADEVGRPLADALIDAIDAAEPLIQKISDGAKAFSNMSREQQRAIIKTAAMAAAAGPLLTVLGKLTSGVGGFLQATGGFVQGAGAFFGELKRGGSVAQSFTNAMGGSTTALVGLKAVLGGLAIGAVIAGIELLTHDWREQQRQISEMNGALSDLKGNYDGLGASLQLGEGATGSMSKSLDEMRVSSDEMIESLRQHNERQRETRDEAEVTIAMLGRYRDIIDQAAGKGDEWSGNLGELEWALEGLEEATGKAWSAEDVLTGKFQDEQGEIHNTKDAIDELIEKRQEEARTQALKDLYSEAYKEQIRAEQDLAKAEEAYHRQHDEWVEGVAEGYRKQGKSAEEAAQMAEQAFRNGQYGQLAVDLDNATAKLDGLKQESQTYLDLMNQDASGWGVREGIIHTSDAMMAACEQAGITNEGIKQLAQAMEDAGVSTDAFASVTGEQFAAMAAQCGGSVDDLAARIAGLNALDVEDKSTSITVDDEGYLTAMGERIEWNGSAWVWQETGVTVSTDSLPQAKANIEETEQAQGKLRNTHNTASINGNATTGQATRSLQDTLNATDSLHDKSVDVAASGNAVNGSAASGIWGTKSAIDSLYSREVTVTTHYQSTGSKNAKGGFVVPRHAVGGYYDRPTLIPGVGMIGENGREYYDGSKIVPITNHQYADPLADTIAARIAQKGGGGRPVVNVTINGVSGPDEVARAVTRALTLAQM